MRPTPASRIAVALTVILVPLVLLWAPGGRSSAAAGPQAGEAPAAPPGTTADAVTAFVNVRVVPMEREEILHGQTVLVQDGTIARVGPVDDVTVPEGAAVVEGGGRYLMPGLVDAHVHMSTADAPIYVSHGITSVRNMWGWPELRSLQRRIDEGEVVGPTIYSYSSGLDGPPEYWPYTQLVVTPRQGLEAVAAQADEGWLGIKVYRDLELEVYDAIVAEARLRGLPVVGHVPHRVGISAALAAGQRSLEHLLGYDLALGGAYGPQGWAGGLDEQRMHELARETARAGAFNCPTLVILHQRSVATHDNRIRAVRILHEEGALLLAGSDAGIDVTFPGSGLRSELQYFVDAGLSPYEALRAATVNVARVLDVPGQFGVVRAGARADLILLEADPLADVSNVATLAGVMLRGLWYPTE